MLRRVNVEKVLCLFTFAQRKQELVEHHFANGVARTVLMRDDTHRQIAISRQCRLDDGESDRNVSDRQRFEERSGRHVESIE